MQSNEVYIVISAECDIRRCILGVFSDIDAAQDFEEYCYSKGIGSIIIEEANVNDKFNPEDDQYGWI